MTSTPHSSDRPTVLIVDDDRDLADMYAFQLRDSYTVRTVYSAPQAIDALDETVDVMLLDRRMPRLSGSDVLQRVRASEYDCRVIMITAVDPAFDIVELPFDDYLCKPVGKQTLQAAVHQQLTVSEYGRTVRKLFRARSKLALLEAEKSDAALAASTEYATLKRTATAMRADADSLLSELDEFEAAFGALDRSTTLDGQRIEI